MNLIKTIVVLSALACVQAVNAAGATPVDQAPQSQTVSVVLRSEVEWNHLNPKRGDLAPSAGTLWGDRNGTGPTGFLLKPSDGFESPPHIHNVSYRGVVIRGLMHNDDPDAADMWMPAGSFWTQPKGEVHITAALGADALAYIEIEEGPYLVLPRDEEFDSGERPVNVDPSNMVWLEASDIKWIEQSGVQVAFLWGNTAEGQLNGSFIKLPAGFDGTVSSQGSSFRAVVIQGSPEYVLAGGMKVLEAGSCIIAEGAAMHRLKALSETILYVRTDGRFAVLD